MEELKINDGNGLMDNLGMIDSLILDCNELPKTLIDGQYVLFCSKVVEMVQKLSQLKNGVKNDTESLMKQISELTEYSNDLANQLFQKEKEV